MVQPGGSHRGSNQRRDRPGPSRWEQPSWSEWFPTDLLTFTPIIASGDGGRSWQDGLIDAGLAKTPDSLASDGAGRTLALTGDNTSGKVLLPHMTFRPGRPSPPRRNWPPPPPVADAGSPLSPPSPTPARPPSWPGIAPTPGFPASSPSEAAAGKRPGRPPLRPAPSRFWAYEPTPGSRPGYSLPPAPQTPAISPRPGPSTAASTGRNLRAFPWRGHSGSRRSGRPTERRVRVDRQPGRDQPPVHHYAPGRTWSQLPPPPAGTATLAVTTPGQPQALAVHNTKLTVWALAPGSRQWTKTQTIPVNIQYGSSS